MNNGEKGFTPTPIFKEKNIGVSSQSERGFIRTILLVIIALAALKYFLNWDIFDAAASDQGQSTIGYIRDIFNRTWAYIGAPVTFVWNDIFSPVLALAWENFQVFLEWGRSNSAEGI